MNNALYIVIGLVIIQTTVNIYLMKSLKKGKEDIEIINSNLVKSTKLIKYLMDKIKGRNDNIKDNINLN